MRTVLLASLLILCTTLNAQTYRWTDTAGRTVVSDSAPPGKPKNVVKQGEKPEAGDNQSFATKKAAENHPVTLYTTADCINECKRARELLNGRGVPFNEKILQTEEEFAELKQLVGDTFIPSIKIGSQRYRGFEAGAYDNLLDLAGYPKAGASKSTGTGK